MTIRNKGAILLSTESWTGAMITRPATSITHLRLDGVNFPLASLYIFENLIELNLKNCDYEGYDQESLNNFTKVSLKRLEIFFFESKHSIYLE